MILRKLIKKMTYHRKIIRKFRKQVKQGIRGDKVGEIPPRRKKKKCHNEIYVV
jgi:hypothetical protein